MIIMLMYKHIGKDRWDNAYQWTTTEFIEFLSMFPNNTPIHSDLYIHAEINSCPLDYDGDMKEFISKDKKYRMLVPQKGNPILYIQEGTLPIDIIEDMFDGKAKNLIKKAYDIVGLKKFLAMVFDVVSEGYKDDDEIV